MPILNARTLRRLVICAGAALLLAGCSEPGSVDPTAPPAATSTPPDGGPTSATPSRSISADPAFARLEETYGATLGIDAIDTGTGRTVAYNAGHRIAYASTYKALAAGALLMNPGVDLDEHVDLDADEMLGNSPVTSQHVATGMSLRAVVAAALDQSDNTAGNIVLQRVGGPAGLQDALRKLGDTTTECDRTEPDLNEALPGDARDTSTPRALASDLEELALGTVLSAPRRAQLIDWMRADTTGDDLVRAAVPSDWDVADKTGTGYYGVRNDIAIVWPPSRAPIVLAIQTTKSTQAAEPSDPLVAAAAREALEDLR
jgi:beta-lactamase class A